MQIFGLFSAVAVIVIGFAEREQQGISYFDPHALVIILLGSFGAILLGSKPVDFVRTLSSLREILPFFASLSPKTLQMEDERKQFESLWLAGKRREAIQLAENSAFPSTKLMMEQVLSRANQPTIENRFTTLIHQISDLYGGSLMNWELLAKLGPSFGMVGTITGMIKLFKHFGTGDTNLGAEMSLALLATLYGIAFGAAVAGPISSYLTKLVTDRVNVIKRCEKTTSQLVNMEMV